MGSITFDLDFVQIVTIILAVWGAGLSTVIFISARRDRRRSVSVKASVSYLADGFGVTPVLAINVSNPGYQNVSLASITLRLPDDRDMILPTPRDVQPLPLELSPGSGTHTYIGQKELVESLLKQGFTERVQLRAVCRDATGKEHFGKKFWLALDMPS